MTCSGATWPPPPCFSVDFGSVASAMSSQAGFILASSCPAEMWFLDKLPWSSLSIRSGPIPESSCAPQELYITCRSNFEFSLLLPKIASNLTVIVLTLVLLRHSGLDYS